MNDASPTPTPEPELPNSTGQQVAWPHVGRWRAATGLLALLLVGALGGMYYLWSQNQAKAPAVATTSPSPSATPMAATEKLSLPIDSVASGYQLSLEVPTAWRTVDLRASAYSPSTYSDFNANDLAAILRFVPEHPERNTLYPTIEPMNRLDVLATSTWVTKGNDVATAAQKQAYLGYLGSLKTVADITAKKCTPISMGGSACTDVKVKPQIIQSADGNLSGLAYLSMPTQSVSYDPRVIIEMTGTIAGKSVYVTGSFNLYDNLYTTLGANGAKKPQPATAAWTDQVVAARKAFTDGNPTADTVEMYNRVVTAVKTLSAKK